MDKQTTTIVKLSFSCCLQQINNCKEYGFCLSSLSRQIYAVPDLCCIVSRGLVELVGGVFDPLLSSAIAVFEHVKDELPVIPCLLLATL